MAIVLAILGLLAGAVLGTSSYLRSAAVTNLVNEGKLYLNAIEQFERTYGGSKPGDMANATDYWGNSGSCPASVGSGTCNGNGDGAVAIGNQPEYFLAFHHLMKAGLITGNYTGVADSGGAVDATIGVNVPVLSVKDVSGTITDASATGYATSTATWYEGFWGTHFTVGRQTTNNLPNGAFLTPREAFELDSKYDNGIPSTGWIRTGKWLASCVTNGATDAQAVYQASSNTNDACLLIFLGQ